MLISLLGVNSWKWIIVFSPEELHGLSLHRDGFYFFTLSHNEAAKKDVVAVESEKFPEAFVGRQGAQETFIVLASFDFHQWTFDKGGGHQIQQTHILFSRTATEGELLTQSIDQSHCFLLSSISFGILCEQPFSDMV